jgi:3-methylcrotonyl-CoA carboxylase alpha subunit
VKFRVLHGGPDSGNEIEIELTRLGGGQFRVVIDGEPIEVAASIATDGVLRFENGGAWHRAAGVARGTRRQIWVDGINLSYEVTTGSRAQGAAHDHGLTSPAPGVIAEVHAAPGARVRKGEKLVVLESMKMFFPVLAPHDGRVGQIFCAKGQTVDAGVMLVELLEDSEGADAAAEKR